MIPHSQPPPRTRRRTLTRLAAAAGVAAACAVATGTATATPVVVTDIAITKTAGTPTATSVPFTVTVTNNGDLPIPYEEIEVIDSPKYQAPYTLTLPGTGPLGPGQSVSIPTTMPITTADCGTSVENAVTVRLTSVGLPIQETTYANNYALASANIDCSTDLAVTKTLVAASSESASFRIAVTNLGTRPVAFTDITLTDTPQGMPTTRIALPSTGSLAPGQTITRDTVMTLTGLACDQLVTNTARVSVAAARPELADMQSANNVARAVVPVACVSPPAAVTPGPSAPPATLPAVPPAVISAEPAPMPTPVVAPDRQIVAKAVAPRLSVVKTGPRRAIAGNLITYMVRVTNTGTAPAAAVTIRDVIPRYLVVSRLPAGTRLSNGVASVPVGTLRPGTSRAVSMTFMSSQQPGPCFLQRAQATATGGATSPWASVRTCLITSPTRSVPVTG